MSVNSDQPNSRSNKLGILNEEPLHKNFRIAVTLLAVVPFFLATCLSYHLIFNSEQYLPDLFMEEVILVAILWVTVIVLSAIGTRPPNPKPPVPDDK